MNPLWSTHVGAPLRGLSLARERGWLLTWDQLQQLHLHDRGGRCLASHAAPARVAAACVADDGSALAAVGAGGEVWLLDTGFNLRWEKKLPHPGQAIACDPFGRFLAASDASGNLLLFDRNGHLLAQAQAPRPLRRLAFIPERPRLVGAADFGLVACYDVRLECVWRDGLVANIGSLAVSGNGDTLALAGFSPGLYCYHVDGPPLRWLPLPAVCCLGALRHDGKVVLMANQGKALFAIDLGQTVRDEYDLPASPVAIALGPLGDFAAAALADGTLLTLELA